jgi:Fic family protein
MNPKDFASSTSGKTIKAGQGNTAYWTFIPNPLPPALSADWKITKLISEADRSLSELSGLGRTLPNPDLLIAPFLRREAVLSSRIEGTQSDIDDLYLYEAGQMPLPGLENQGPSEADLREVFNYVVALKFGLSRLDVLPVSLRLITETHKVLMQGVRGEHATPGKFRTRQNWIGGTTINDAVYVPPPVEEMQAALNSFEKYLHSEDSYPPLMRLALIHYQFEAIHPFVDGNGRMGRLLLSLLMMNWNLLSLPLLYLSAYFERNRQMYYDLLLGTSQKGAWEEWVTFFLRGVQEQAKDAILRIKSLQDLQTKWKKRLGDSRASANALWLVDRLFETPVITIPQAQKLLNVKSYRTAQQSIEKLASLKIISPLGKATYDKRYIAREIILAITDKL